MRESKKYDVKKEEENREDSIQESEEVEKKMLV